MKRYALFIFFLLFATHVFAQYDYEDEDLKKRKPENNEKKEEKKTDGTTPDNPNKKFDKNKLSVGGFFGASFGNVIYVEVSPVAAYRFHKRFALGVGFIYQYLNYKDYYPPPWQDYNKTNIFGGRIFPRAFVWEELFVQLEYMPLNAEVAYVDGNGTPLGEVRETFHNVFAGAGYNIPLGENSYFTILASINLTENLVYPSRQPFISFGFGVGF